MIVMTHTMTRKNEIIVRRCVSTNNAKYPFPNDWNTQQRHNPGNVLDDKECWWVPSKAALGRVDILVRDVNSIQPPTLMHLFSCC
jgi:hypothetical protein